MSQATKPTKPSHFELIVNEVYNPIMGYPPEIHIHIHPEGEPPQAVLSTPPVQKTPRRTRAERRPAANIKDSVAQTWWRREMYSVFEDGYPLWEKLHGSERAESVDMAVEFEGPEMDFLRILKRAKGAFLAGFSIGLNAEKQAKKVKEKGEVYSENHPESRDNVLEYCADLMDAMPVGQERKSQLKADILTQEISLAS